MVEVDTEMYFLTKQTVPKPERSLMETFRERPFGQAVPFLPECGFDADMGGRRERFIFLGLSEGVTETPLKQMEGLGLGTGLSFPNTGIPLLHCLLGQQAIQ